jgi:hypothetical protein
MMGIYRLADSKGCAFFGLPARLSASALSFRKRTPTIAYWQATRPRMLANGLSTRSRRTWAALFSPPIWRNGCVLKWHQGHRVSPSRFFEISRQAQGFYPRPGELTVWSGPTEAGKSTFLNFFMASLALNNHGVFIASMEMRPETLLARMYKATVASLGRTVDDTPVSVFLAECGSHISIADVVGYIDQSNCSR